MLSPQDGDPEIITNTGLYYRVWRPDSNLQARPPLVVLVHGRAGNAEVMWIFAKSVLSLNPVIVAPQAPVEDQIGGWSWWRVSDPDPNRSADYKASPEEIIERAHELGEFVQTVQAAYQTDPAQTIALGFSQGGAILGTLALERPSLFSKVGLLASFVPKAILERAKSNPNLPPFFFAHGTKDQIVSLERAENSANELRRLGAEVKFTTDDVGHKVGSPGIRALTEWVTAE